MMKHVKVKTFWQILMILLCLLLLTTMGVAAAEKTAKDGDGTPVTTVTFSKDNVRAGETVDVKVTLQNNTSSNLKDVTLDASLPDGLKAVNNTTAKHYDLIQPGETVESTITAKADGAAAGGSGVATGVDGGSLLAIALLLIILAGVVIFVYRGRRNQRSLCLILCLALTMGSLPLANLARVNAEEASADSNTTTNASYNVLGKIKVNGNEETVAATVKVGTSEAADIAVATITSSDSVAAGADKVAVTVHAEGDTFVKGFEKDGAGQVTLSQGFSGMTVSDIKKIDDSNMTLTLTGKTNSDAPGQILFDGQSLATLHDPVTCTVQTQNPEPSFTISQCKVENGVMSLYFTVDRAEFTSDVKASDFSFQDYDGAVISGFRPQTIQVQNAHDAILTAAIDGMDSSQWFSTLDGGTMVIDGHATNCDTLNAPFYLMDNAEVVVSVTPDVEKSSITRNTDNPDTATLSGFYTAKIYTSGAPVSLSDGDIAIMNDTLGIYSYEYQGSSYAGKSEFTFRMSETIDAPTAGDNFGDYSNELMIMPYGVNVCIKNLKDAYGKPYSQTIYSMVPSAFVEESAEANGLETQGGLSKNPSKKELYEYGKKVGSGIGTAIGAVKKGDYLKGITAILGINADDPNKEILDELAVLHAQNNDLQTSVNNLIINFENNVAKNTATDHLDKYRKNFNDLDTVVGSVDNVYNVDNPGSDVSNPGSLIVKLATLDLDKDKEAYDAYAKRIVNIVNGRGISTGQSGFNVVLNQTEELGNMLLGEGGYDQPIFEDFNTLCSLRYNWEPESFADKQAFRAAAISKYNDAYLICMIYMKSTSTETQHDVYYNDTLKLQDQIEKINAMVGSADYQVNARSDGKVYNYVTKKAYGSNSFSDFSVYDYQESAGDYKYADTVDSASFNCDTSDLRANNRWPLQEMERRRSNAGYSNLYDEWRAMGFNFNSSFMYMGNYSRTHQNPKKGFSFTQIDTYYADYYDLRTGQYVQNASIGRYQCRYHAFKGWKTSPGQDTAVGLLRFNPNK